MFRNSKKKLYKLYGNLIKILGLNQVRKEKEKQKRQHLEDVRNQRFLGVVVLVTKACYPNPVV